MQPLSDLSRRRKSHRKGPGGLDIGHVGYSGRVGIVVGVLRIGLSSLYVAWYITLRRPPTPLESQKKPQQLSVVPKSN